MSDKKYIIIWNAGYGENAEIIEAKSQKEAQEQAYQTWLEDAQSSHSWKAHEYSDELAENYDL